MGLSRDKTTWHIVPILCFAFTMVGMSIDLYVPSLPWIVNGLDTNMHLVKLTIPLYLCGFAIAPFLFGPWLDAAGRKKPLLTGVIIYVIATLICAGVTNIWQLLILRFIQGFAIAVISVCYRTIIADVFINDDKTIQSAAASIGISWALGSVAAPLIGGYIQHFLSWRVNFLFLGTYGVVVTMALAMLPETHYNRTPLHQQRLLHNYGKIFSHHLFIKSIVVMSAFYGVLIIFNIVGPFLVQDILHYTPIDFGHIALAIGGLFLVGTYSYRLLLRYFAIIKVINIGMVLIIIANLVLLIVTLLYPLNLWRFILPMFVLIFFLSTAGLLQSSSALCIKLFPDMAGIAGTATTVAYLLGTSLIGIIASFVKSDSAVPLACADLVLMMVSSLIYFFSLKKHLETKR